MLKRSENDLVAALKKSEAINGLTFIEATLDRTDCNKALLGWGTAVAEYNGGARATPLAKLTFLKTLR